MASIRQNFHDESEKAINDQINMELNASYIYQSMSSHFERSDVALPGFSAYFHESSEEEREHAEKLMKYLNKRGGRVILQDVKRPEKDEWGTGLNALEITLNLEKSINESLLKLHSVASAHNDAHLADYLEKEFLEEQVKSIQEYAELIVKAKRAGPGLGEYLFDKNLKS